MTPEQDRKAAAAHFTAARSAWRIGQKFTSMGRQRQPGFHARRKARRAAMQALYQWDLSGGSASEIEAQFRAEQPMEGVDLDYFAELLRGTLAEVAALDEAIARHVDRPLAQVDPVERAILRLAAYELAHRLEVPYRVVIDEAVELAKRFGAENGHRFVNGVLDRLARELRAVETAASGGAGA